MRKNGILPINEMKNQLSAAVTIALLKFAGSACFNKKYSGIPITKNTPAVNRIGHQYGSLKTIGIISAINEIHPMMMKIPPRSLNTVFRSLIVCFPAPQTHHSVLVL